MWGLLSANVEHEHNQTYWLQSQFKTDRYVVLSKLYQSLQYSTDHSDQKWRNQKTKVKLSARIIIPKMF